VKGFKLINKDGSGNPGRYLFFWSLPLYKDTDDYKSPHTQTRHIFNFMVERGVQTIAFTRSRKMAELNASYSKRMFKNNGKSHLATRIMSYRAGYLKEHRRLIEEGLKEKKFLGVYATNALELGVDIGTLECSILSGYPGTISSWWQQIGRAGRKHELDSSTPGRINFAGSFYVPLANPLDFYYLNHPEELLEKPHENCYIDLKNKYILANHLKCAAKEMVLIPQDLEMFGESMEDRLIELEEQGEVKKAGKNYYYSGKESFVPKSVKLTSRSDDSFQVVLKQKYNRKPVITSEDKNYAIKELHPGAIYYYMTEAYIVTEFDYDKMKIILEPFNGDYYTEAAVITSIRELGPPAKSKVVENNGKKLNVYYGDVMVEENVIGYRVKNIITDEIIDYKELDMPPLEMETKALWFTISNEDKNAIMEMKYNFAGSIHAIEHAAIGMAPYFTSCDRSDLGGVSVEIKDNTKANPAAIYIYDGFPGGIGLSELLYNKINELLEKTLIMISECPCKEKCPACVMSPKCGNNNEPLDKYGAIALLKLILGKPIQKKEIKNKKQK
ncbi:MAG: DEAD/DEAH box helicase, partial [Promethearchaeota archaeon]